MRDLAAEAGGLDQAFAAAFGPQAGRFFSKVSRSSPPGRWDAGTPGRRDAAHFSMGLAAGAALVTLTNCCNNREQSGGRGPGD